MADSCTLAWFREFVHDSRAWGFLHFVYIIIWFVTFKCFEVRDLGFPILYLFKDDYILILLLKEFEITYVWSLYYIIDEGMLLCCSLFSLNYSSQCDMLVIFYYLAIIIFYYFFDNWLIFLCCKVFYYFSLSLPKQS